MGEHIRFVGLDVHANSIAVAVADSGISQEVEFLPRARVRRQRVHGSRRIDETPRSWPSTTAMAC